MITKQITISNPCGIHVRPAGIVAKEMAKFPNVTFEIDNGEGFRKTRSIMSLMLLALSFGKTILLRAYGPNEEVACNTVAQLLGGEFECDKDYHQLRKNIAI